MPNLITLVRILIVPIFFSCLLYYTPDRPELRIWAFALFLLASLTDALDGLLARIKHQVTHLGRFLDPLADKLLVTSGYVGVILASGFPLKPPVWVVVTILFRDLIIVGGLILFFVTNGKVEANPNFMGKITTAFQMATMLSILLLLPLSEILWLTTAVLTIISGLIYAARGLRKSTAKFQ